MLKMFHVIVVRTPAEISPEAGGVSASYKGELRNIDNSQEQVFGARNNTLSRDSHGTRTSTTHSAIGKHLDVEELEMLLEAYFVQIDGTLNKLSTVWNCIYELSLFLTVCLDLHPAIPRLTLHMMSAFQIVDRPTPEPIP
jgi:hypothetical protein